MVLQTRDILASLLVLFLILEATVTSPTHLLNETSSEDTDAANVTNFDLKERLTSEEAFRVDLLAEGRSEEHLEDDLQEERISEEHSEDDLQERVGSNDVSFFVRLLNTIKSFRDGFSPRETQRKV